MSIAPETIRESIGKLPDEPGVYFFLGENSETLYIGKATSLKDRVKSYWTKDILEARGPLIVSMLPLVKNIEFRKTDSVLEALLLEASLIKNYKPRFNTRDKDDKSFNYVVITDEPFPRVLLVRGRNVFSNLEAKSYKLKAIYGPFPQGLMLKEALKIIRKIFPYRDNCIPFEEVKKKKDVERVRGCFNSQIGLCPGVCAGRVSKQEYRRTIRHLRLFLEGKKKQLVRLLEKEMKAFAKERKFEEADKAKRIIFSLNHIQDVALLKRETRSLGLDRGVFRIEAFDVAHISGTDMVGAMTVVEDGELKKSDYRKFKIKSVSGANDTAALKEILERRFRHEEWRLPNMIVFDGGIAQENTVREVILKQFGRADAVAIAGVVKDERHKASRITGATELTEKYKNEIVLANSEAHRFAVGFHRLRRGKRLFH